MKIQLTTLLILLLALSTNDVYGQQECNALLAQGIRESVKTHTYSGDYAQVKSAVCEAYTEYRKGNDAAKASGSYAKIFKGGGSYSKDRIESLGKTYCESGEDTQTGVDYSTVDRTYIDPNFSLMYRTCVAAATSQNLKLKLEPTDALNKSITVTASYLSPGGARPKVTDVDFDSTSLEVRGSLKDAADRDAALDGFLTLRAVRKDIRDTPFQFGNDLLLAKAQQMTIAFENGAITINFPEIRPTPPPITLTTGIGEIVASMLSEAQFKDAYGKNGEKWELAQGQEAHADSKYRQFVGERLPDLRGVFLRGKNYGRETTTGNPEGELNVGEYRKDEVGAHTHGLTQLGIGGGETDDRSDNVRARFRNPVPKTTDSFGGQETRPRNVTVNYFIRVD
jgi:hypothetical protein